MTRAFAIASSLALAACAERAPWDEAPPAAIAVVARASATEVSLLEPFEVVVDVFRRADLPTEFSPKPPEGTAGSVRLGEEREIGNGFWRRARLSLRATNGPGPLSLGPFKAVAGDKTASAESEVITLTVRPALDASSGADVEDPSPLLEATGESRSWSYAVVAAVVAALLASVLAWASRRHRVLPPRLADPPEPPDEKALRELAQWRAASRQTAEEVDAYYVGCSHALRVYLEERFGLRAPERTTEEFLAEAEEGGPLSAGHCITLRAFLSQCDLVKFAMHAPTEEQHLQAMAIAEDFVHATRDPGAPSPRLGGGA